MLKRPSAGHRALLNQLHKTCRLVDSLTNPNEVPGKYPEEGGNVIVRIEAALHLLASMVEPSRFPKEEE